MKDQLLNSIARVVQTMVEQWAEAGHPEKFEYSRLQLEVLEAFSGLLSAFTETTDEQSY